MPANKGYCFLCDKIIAKTAIKNHIIKNHNKEVEKCALIKAEGFYAKNYWLFFSIPLDAELSHIDDFLRSIWCECCHHLSGFRIGRLEISPSTEVGDLSIGDKLIYEYDYGSTTEIMLSIESLILRPEQKKEILLYARNEPLVYTCDLCKEKQAEFVDRIGWKYIHVCEVCREKLDEPEIALPIVNSPRCGVCGYSGEHDFWTV